MQFKELLLKLEESQKKLADITSYIKDFSTCGKDLVEKENVLAIRFSETYKDLLEVEGSICTVLVELFKFKKSGKV